MEMGTCDWLEEGWVRQSIWTESEGSDGHNLRGLEGEEEHGGEDSNSSLDFHISTP